jgi:exodeoxyribonuclease VII small subunit
MNRLERKGEFVMAKASAKKTEKTVEDLSYEEAMGELEGIVESLEGDASRHPLEESMRLFERGQALITRCGVLLEAAQLKVQKLAGDLVVPFEEESE